MALSVGYHDIKKGMRFEEVREKGPPRVVLVVEGSLYHVLAHVESGRGTGSKIQLFRKHLSNEKRWRLLP